MMGKSLVIRQSAEAILLGEHTEDGIGQSLAACWNVDEAVARPLAKAINNTFVFKAYPSLAKHYLIDWLQQSELFTQIFIKHRLKIYRWPLRNFYSPLGNLSKPHKLQEKFKLPKLNSLEDLVTWLNIDLNDLHWLADAFLCNRPSAKFYHYHYKTLEQVNGKIRILEIPKPRLKEAQSKILQDLLAKIPSHNSAHGFVKGRSTRSFAEPHVNRALVLRLDIQDFFYSFNADQVANTFCALGYPKKVSKWLKGLCTNRILDTKFSSSLTPDQNRLLRREHLAQGAPTSPALANLMMYRVDCRINGLCESLGFSYTRYADDLAFSSDNANTSVARLIHHVGHILKEHRLQLHPNKTKIMRRHNRQRLAGIVVNQKLAVTRKDIKCLEAELFNCVRFGPNTQNKKNNSNYRAHLQGRIAYISAINPERSKKLYCLFDQINW